MRIALGLGSSLGDRRRTLERTVLQLAAHPDLDLLRVSRWYRTPPMHGGHARGWFLNGVATFTSRLSPHDVLGLCRRLEEEAGRRRALHWGDRPLDLDVLLAEDFRCDDDDLTVPHPGLLDRPFVYWPLTEAWPGVDRLILEPGGPRPSRHGIVAVGAFARRQPPAYVALPLGPGCPHEALHRQRQPRPHPRDPLLGRARWRHHQPLADREGRR